MNYLKSGIILLLFFLTVNLFSDDRSIDVSEILGIVSKSEDLALMEKYDTNNDGAIDYMVGMGLDSMKILESIDFNHDGAMDDLYFYSNGIIVRQEVDSNYDYKIDIWVYIKDGSSVEKYEQDTDFDGIIDKVEKFGGE
ncbi:MAG: hypothetical protein L3J12_01300 [Spirochaetales bacterium]|nr:hypothetical protein [Spirochaetales bacterium]